MGEEAIFASLGKWGLPVYVLVHLFREWMAHRERMQARRERNRLQGAIRIAHDALPEVPSMYLQDDDAWPAVEKARVVLSESLPPKGR